MPVAPGVPGFPFLYLSREQRVIAAAAAFPSQVTAPGACMAFLLKHKLYIIRCCR